MWTYNYTNELYHHGVKGMKWGVRKQNKISKNRNKAKQEFDSHLKKNNGYIKNTKRYQEMPITRMTKDKRYSDYYMFDRKRKTIVSKSIVSSFGGKRITDITDADYKRGEELVKKLSDDWVANRKYFGDNLLDPMTD